VPWAPKSDLSTGHPFNRSAQRGSDEAAERPPEGVGEILNSKKEYKNSVAILNAQKNLLTA